MDINNVNLNKVYSLVSAAGNEQVLNVSEDLKTLSLAESNPNPTKEQVETNRKFHDGLLSSLQEITNDETVLKEVRGKLGLSEGSEKVEPKSILARDIKSAIDLVMAKVSTQIGKVLTRSFPPAVNELILEAVKANPKHDVVKAFLKEEGGTLDNLARLCRLTCQSLQDGANSAALAYLDGFAYDIADFGNVLRVSVSDNQQYAAGVSHRKEEETAQAEKEKKEEQSSVKKEQQPVKKEQQNVTNGFLVGSKLQNSNEKKTVTLNLGEIKEEDENEEAANDGVGKDNLQEQKQSFDKDTNNKIKNVKNNQDKNDDDNKINGDEKNNIEVKNNEVKDKKNDDNNVKVDVKNNIEVKVNEDKVDDTLLVILAKLNEKGSDLGLNKFSEVLREDKDKYFSTCIKRFLEDSCKSDFEHADKYESSLVDEMRDLLPYEQYLREPKKLLEEAIFRAKATIRRPEVFAAAVKLCKEKIGDLEKAIQNGNWSDLRKKPLKDLLPLVSEPLAHQQGDLYDTMSKVYTSGMRNNKPEDDVVKDVAKVIENAISRALDERDWRQPQEVAPTNPKNPKNPNALYKENTLLTQGNTNMCYLRSLENALLERGKTLPKPINGTYTFDVAFVNGTNEKGEELTFTRQITVEKDEIQTLKNLYVSKKCLGNQEQDLTDLDWAVNIAQAKKRVVQNVLDRSGGNEAQKAEDAKKCNLEKLTKETISLQDDEGKYNIACQFITESGHDEDVAALFGLTSEPESISINHAGYVQGQNRTLQDYLLSADKDLNPASLYENFNRVREWKKANPHGILTLNEAGRHFVAITGFYFNGDKDFGFIVRDSMDAKKKESTVNVVGYTYDESADEGECHKLSVHCYPAPAKPAA